MKVKGWLLVIGTLACSWLGLATVARADTAQEVFICKLNEGKTMADVNKAIADFKQMVVKLKGGDKYQAWLLTPVAAEDLSTIVWVGEMSDQAGLAGLGEEYMTSEAGKAQDKKFRDVMTCKSRSVWQSAKIK